MEKDDCLKFDNVNVDDNGGFTFEIFGKRLDKTKDIYLLNKTFFNNNQIELKLTSFRNSIRTGGTYTCCLGNGAARR